MLLRTLLPAAALTLLTTPSWAAAQGPASPPPLSAQALQQCRAITDGAARLACFDQAAQRLTTDLASGKVVIMEREQIRRARRSLFGFSVSDLPFFGGKDSNRPEDRAPRELVSTLVTFKPLANGRYRFSIADAKAVWETTESSALNDPRKGESVTIKRGALGSFFVQIGRQRWVRARRLS